MYREKKIAVVIPAYNVAAHIRSVVDGLPALVDRIVVVDDASKDRTAEVLAALSDPRVQVLSMPLNTGVGGAMVEGFRAAVAGGADVVVKMDGDGQMDPQQLPRLLDAIVVDGYDYAKGNRFLDSDELAQMPKLRLLGNFVLSFLTKMSSGYWNVFDPQNGFVAIDAAVLRKLPLERLSRRYFFENDMLVHLNIVQARVKDVAIPARYGDERSSLRVSHVLATFPTYLCRRFWYRVYQRHVLRDFSVVAVFWVVGAALVAWGVGFGATMWVISAVSGRLASTGTVMLAALPLILGFQLVLQAILLEVQESSR
jgi:dolichol-phosphate mannosyltransferase